jgi:hypothetical protein
MATFYACFLLSYLLYRTRSPRYIFAAAVFGAATFYSYSNGMMVMATAGLLLFVTDFRYHVKHGKTALCGLALMAFLAIPALRFRAASPGALTEQLKTVQSYWFKDVPVQEKVLQFAKTYAYGMSPSYWFKPNDELIRHRMKGYGHLNGWLLPPFLLGLGIAAWRAIRGSAPHRILLLATLATPAGAALAEIGITRVFAFVIPATILIGVGIEALYAWIARRIPEAAVAAVFGLGLTVPGVAMLRDALTNGPVWFTDYTLYGMQWGSRQVFGELVPGLLHDFPDATIGVSPNWANGAELFIQFFIPQPSQPRVQMAWIGEFLSKKVSIPPNLILVMPADEYAKARDSDKFKEVKVERVIPYPDGRSGFYAVRLTYAADAERLFAEEHARRSQLVAEEVVIDGETVTVTHSQFDGGTLASVFDGNTDTLARGFEANPLVLDFAFAAPRPVTGLLATFGTMDLKLTAELWEASEGAPRVFAKTFRDLPIDPTVEMSFDGGSPRVSRLRLSILQSGAGVGTHIHVREVTLRPASKKKPLPSKAPLVVRASIEVSETIDLGGVLADVVHSKLDGGRIQDVFDNDKRTLARTEDADVAVFDLTFSAPRKMTGVEVTTGTMSVVLKVTVRALGKAEPLILQKTFTDQPQDPTVSLDFGGTREVKRIRLEVSDLSGGDGHVHVREIRFH